MAIQPPPPPATSLPATKVKITANIQSESNPGSVGKRSIKTDRTYQVGVIYKDIYGRETPVFTNPEAAFTIDKAFAAEKNAIVANLENVVPQWVDTYKFFVKETSNEYYNVCMDRWYDSEDENIWLSFPSAERNKLQEDNFIILKKKADKDGNLAAVREDAKYKIIDISNEAPDDIKTDYEMYGAQSLEVLSGTAIPGSRDIKFDWNTTAATKWSASVFYDAVVADTNSAGTETGFVGWPLEDVVIKFSKADGENTGWLDVANIRLDTELQIQLSKPLTGSVDDPSSKIISILPTGEGVVSVKIAKRVVKKKPEFDGRFFVKIRRDGTVDEYIRSVGNPSPSFIIGQAMKQYSLDYDTSEFTSISEGGGIGERWYIDSCSRGNVGTGGPPPNGGSDGPYPEDYGYGIRGNEGFKRSGSAKESLRCTMELSLNYIKDSGSMSFGTSSNSSSDKTFLSTMSTTGTTFRWKEDPFQHIYVVDTVYNSQDGVTNGRGIVNFSTKSWAKKSYRNKTVRLYLKLKTTGWRLNDDQSVATAKYEFDPTEKDKNPFHYNNTPSSGYTPDNSISTTSAVATSAPWAPDRKGYADYGTGSPSFQMSNGASGKVTQNGASFSSSDGNYNTIEIINITDEDGEPQFTKNPAIWETEPREDVGLDIYYEASQAYPVKLGQQTNELFAPYGCTVTCNDVIGDFSFYLPENTALYDWAPTGHGGDTLLLTTKVSEVGIVNYSLPTAYPNHVEYIVPGSSVMSDLNALYTGLELQFTRLDGSSTTAKIESFSGWDSTHHYLDGTNPSYTGNGDEKILIKLNRDLTKTRVKLPYFNCYSFGNGVESDRIRDDFNAIKMGKGVKVSTVLPETYQEEQRTNGLIYSGIYNSNSNLNNLNQFIGAEKITKDVPPSYGSIQKLKARDTNLVVFCEDKILKITAHKDALYKADGNPDIISTNKVLGSVSSFAGEFGISTNPESYAEDSFRMYCTDKQRGKVLRISGDGITPISAAGMVDYFGDNLKANNTLLGSFDDRKQEYNLTLKTQRKTLSFSESAKGWTSFKSFIPEKGLSINNNYYTFKDGDLWKHHTNATRNNFYGDQYDSSVDVVFNEQSESVKSFASMKYEGTQAKVTQNVTDGEYYNNKNTSTIPGFLGKQGWYVKSGVTDLQVAGGMEFKNKEGKYFSYMKGKPVGSVEELNSEEFSFQGIALLKDITEGNNSESFNCDIQNIHFSTLIDNAIPGAFTVVPSSVSDDMPYSVRILGTDGFVFTNPVLLQYAGSVSFTGLTFQQYTVTVTSANGCQATQLVTPPPPLVFGCTDATAINYDPLATTDDFSCVVCSSIQIQFTVAAHPMSNLSDGIRVISYLTGDDFPYSVACFDSGGIAVGGMSVGSSVNGDVVFFGQGSPLPTDTYTIIITTAHGCTSQETILIDNGGVPPTHSNFQITIQDIGDIDNLI
tara:strand:- start:1856 stop:6166 length:4311 start_codon:yes stop_codon:yes gene_type:complete